MEAICVMQQITPIKKTVAGKIIDDYWSSALKMLGDLRFLDILRGYDKDNIPVSVMKIIREVCVLTIYI